MSSATDADLAPLAAARPVGLIAGIVLLEVLTYSMTDYSAVGGAGAAVPWILLDAYLLRRIWHGSHGAWSVLVALNIAVLGLAAWTLAETNVHMEGGPWLAVQTALELALLAAPGLRRWVAEG